MTQFDQDDKFRPKLLAKIDSKVSQITKIIYNPDFGLIMACFMGYVEVFDPIEFKSRAHWDNEIQIHKDPSEEAKETKVRKN